MRRSFIAVALMASLVAFATTKALSVEADEDVEEQVEQGDPVPEPTAPSPETFIPTEEISEDFAVPFPVDI